MTTDRDLLEARAFCRRRLVTAFVSGAPGGREAEPDRPVRAVVVGTVLAGLLVTAAAVVQLLSPRVDPEWAQRPGLVVTAGGAGAYVITAAGSPPVLHPVPDLTSARLVLGSDVEPRVVPRDLVEQEALGGDLGIVGAPPDVPRVDRLVGTGWTACTEAADPSSGPRVAVTGTPQVRPADPDAATLVTVDGHTWLVATSGPDEAGEVSAHRHRVPDVDGRAAVVTLDSIGLDQGVPRLEVGRAWLALFPRGAPVSARSFAGVTPRVGDGGVPRPGDVVRVDDTPYLTTVDGELVRLDGFALGVATGGDPGPAYDGPVTFADDDPLAGNRWPRGPLRPAVGERCAVLRSAPGRPPRVTLAEDPWGDATAAGTAGRSVHVSPGSGAVVRVGGWGGAAGGPVLVDSRGDAHRLVGRDTAVSLGYGDYAAPVVPRTWLALLGSGVPLSRHAALCGPVSEGLGCG